MKYSPPQETHSPLPVFLKPFLKRFLISRYLMLLMLSAKKRADIKGFEILYELSKQS